ncbi:MAG: GrpB family protein [Chitinophagaceae bacterium]|nr:GrpB family protein [Chitinophagaceae bacterium]
MKIELIAYKDSWKEKFKIEKVNIETILSEYNLHIEHIGSTALYDGYAKPIIDILIGIDNEKDVEDIIEILIKNGYIYYKVLDTKYPERKHLVKIENKTDITTVSTTSEDVIDALKLKRVYHLSITKFGSYYWKRHLAFRDKLISDEKIRIDYFNLKLMLSQQEWADMEEYSDSKTDFIRNIENQIL